MLIGQSVQLVTPAVDENFPAGHAKQVPDTVKLPVGQVPGLGTTHSLVDGSMPESAGQVVQVARLFVVEYVLASAHRVHAVWPPLSEKVPTGHAWQAECVPSMKNWPALQQTPVPVGVQRLVWVAVHEPVQARVMTEVWESPRKE